MDLSNEEILTLVDSLRLDSKTMNESGIKLKYADFIEKFPKLYYLALTPGFNKVMLTNMLNYRTKAKKENIPDLVRDVTIGEEMAKRYLYPVVGEPTIKQKKEAAKKVAVKVAQQKTSS